MNLVGDFLCLVLGVVGSCEVILRSPTSNHISRLARSIGQAMSRLSSDSVSDHWKALAARKYAVVVLSSTLFLCGVLLATLAPIAAGLWLVSSSLDAMLALALRPDIVIASAVVAGVYLSYRTRTRSRG